jgi:LPXTG-site transpeptidase (sortase) family protein
MTKSLFIKFFSASLIVMLALAALPVTPARALTINVNITTDTVANDANCSLREAIAAANADVAFFGCSAGSGADTIVLLSGSTYELTLTTAGTGDLDVTSQITIQPNGPGSATIDPTTPGFNERVFDVSAAGNLTIDNIIITTAITANSGAAVNNAGTLTIQNGSQITNNTSNAGGGGSNGGGIASGGTLSISNTTFTSNSATNNGGGIYISGGTATITSSTFNTHNAGAIDDGAAIYLDSGTLTINGGSFSSNTASGDGGAIYVDPGGTLTIGNTSGVTFTSNSADNGGAIYHNAATLLTVTNSTFTGNTSTNGDGGAIMMDANGSSLTISGSTFTSNSAEDDAGAVYSDGEPVLITNSTFQSNSAGTGAGGGADGGAIRISGSSTSATSRINLSTFINNFITMAANQTLHGGAIANDGTLIIANVTFSGNSLNKTTAGTGDALGGAIYGNGTTTVHNVTMSGNTVSESGTGTASGGSLYGAGGALAIANSIAANGTENGAAGNCGGTITNNGNNIDFNGGDCGFAITANPNLGALTGSPQYFPLGAGSSALNTGNNAICATATSTNNQSQNGVTRPANVTCDIGSYEAPASATLTLLKAITNDNGGTVTDHTLWTLNFDDGGGNSGSGAEGDAAVTNATVPPGVYTLSESGGPSGYTTDNIWNCIGFTNGGSVDDDELTINAGENVTCTITNDDQQGSLQLVKVVTNDNGGTLTNADFPFTDNIPGTLGAPVVTGSAPTLTYTYPAVAVDAGAYTFSEGDVAGYTEGTWSCIGATATGTAYNGGGVTVPNGGTVVCSITNNDNPTTLTLVKQVTNDHGGTNGIADWALTADGNPFTSGVSQNVTPGTYTLAESGPSGYTASAWVCVGGTQAGSDITLAQGENATCTITNDDNAASLTLVKQVTNNNGGTNVAGDWTLTADGTPFTSGVSQNVSAGTYTLAESGPSGYTASAWSCVGGSQIGSDITLALGESATCTITNDDQQATLTLVKQVTNNNGGTNVIGDWALTAEGTPFTSGVSQNVNAGTYTLAESGPSGYSASAWVCVGGSQAGSDITLAPGQSATCTITNDDDAASLTLVKQVINDNGGSNAAGDWTLTADGTSFTSGVSQNVNPGTYTLAESGPSGYTASAWVCVGGSQTGSDITLALGESATCTITNNDIAPTLTLVKNVTNNDGGTAAVGDWTLDANGPSTISGVTGAGAVTSAIVDAGSYSLGETAIAGYTQTAITCSGSDANGADGLDLDPGENVTCTFFNDDIGATLTLLKDVTNNNIGIAADTDWTLTATGPSTVSGIEVDAAITSAGVSAGNYTLTESGPANYTQTAITCTGGADTDGSDGLTLALGEVVTCTFFNDDDVPVLLVPNVNSAPDTGDATIAENEVILNTLNVHQITVQFNWDADNPAGTSGTDDVDNPENYILLYSAAGAFNTPSCAVVAAGGVVAPDIRIPVTTVTYSDGGGSGPFIATLNLSSALTNAGYYRLFVCGTTSIVLAADPTVALSGNGAAGTDFIRNFQISVPSAGGGAGAGRGGDDTKISALAIAALPATGFAPNRVTVLPEQPADLAYADLGDLWIEIPALGVKEPIVGVPQTAEGEWDVTWLANNIGWLNGTAFPTWEGNSVVTAHVTNADGLEGPFANLKKLKYGDQIIVHLYDEKYTFEVRNSRLSRPYTTSFAFEHLEEQSYLTLITCQYYLPKSDSYYFRRVVRAVLVKVESE